MKTVSFDPKTHTIVPNALTEAMRKAFWEGNPGSMSKAYEAILKAAPSLPLGDACSCLQPIKLRPNEVNAPLFFISVHPVFHGDRLYASPRVFARTGRVVTAEFVEWGGEVTVRRDDGSRVTVRTEDLSFDPNPDSEIMDCMVRCGFANPTPREVEVWKSAQVEFKREKDEAQICAPSGPSCISAPVN